jgi:hypothetical protein
LGVKLPLMRKFSFCTDINKVMASQADEALFGNFETIFYDSCCYRNVSCSRGIQCPRFVIIAG